MRRPPDSFPCTGRQAGELSAVNEVVSGPQRLSHKFGQLRILSSAWVFVMPAEAGIQASCDDEAFSK